MCQSKAPLESPMHPWARCQMVPLWTDYPQVFWDPSQSLLRVISMYWLLLITSPSGWKSLQSQIRVQWHVLGCLNKVIAKFGCPYDIHSDQGCNYESAIFPDLCHLLEIWKTRTTPGHPCCNGQVDQFNRTLVGMIKCYLMGQQCNWDQHLGCLAATYQATPHESTDMTPNLLMFGRDIRMPIEVMLGVSKNPNQEEVTSYGDYVDTLREWKQQVHDIAWKYMGKNAIQTKEHYDAKCKLTKYKHGDLVWYATDIKQLHPSSQVTGTIWRLISCTRQNKWPRLLYSVGIQAQEGCPGLWLPSNPRRSRGPTVYKAYLYVVWAM